MGFSGWLIDWHVRIGGRGSWLAFFVDLKQNVVLTVQHLVVCCLLRVFGCLVCDRHCWREIAPWDCPTAPRTATPHTPTPTTQTNPNTSTSSGGTKTSSSRFALTGWPCWHCWTSMTFFLLIFVLCSEVCLTELNEMYIHGNCLQLPEVCLSAIFKEATT